MEEDVKIPIKLAVDSSDLETLKQEVSKTFADIHRYESRLSDKGNTFKLGGIAEMEQSLDGTISKIGLLIDDFNKAKFDTPVKALSAIQEEIDKTNESLRTEKANLEDINKALAESSKSYEAARKRRDYNNKKAEELTKKYEKQSKSIDTSEKGSKSRLRDLEKEYQAQKAIYEDRVRQANTVMTADNISKAAAREDLKLSQNRINLDAQRLSDLEKQEAEMLKIVSSEEKTNQYLADRQARMKEINAELQKQKDLTYSNTGAARETLENDQAKTGVSARTKYEEAVYRNKVKIANDAAKEEQDGIKNTIAAYNKEMSAVKQSAAQYYYKLRAVKMLGFVMNQTTAAVDNFGKKAVSASSKALKAYLRLIPGVNAVRRAIEGSVSGQKRLDRETKSLTKSSQGLNMTFGQLVKKVLAYGLGIRSLYMLFRKLRKAISEGFESMAQQVDDVNEKMSSIVTSMAQMKAGVTAAVQPLLSVLAPALERIAAVIAEIAYQVASFIAALTGQSVVYKAARVQQDYAASLDKTGKSAKKAKKELAGFDELNVLHTKDDDGGADFGGMAWDPVELSKQAEDLAKKFKEILNKLFTPLKTAWDNVGAYVMKSWKDALLEIKALGADIARDFWKVWEEDATQKIFENLLFVLADIGQIVGNLTRNIRKAWNTAKSGYRIFASIRDIILIISDGIRQAAEYTVQWSKELNFVPAMTNLADAMQTKLVPAVQKVVDLFVVLYEQVVLKITKDFVEKALPKMETVLGKVAEAIGNVAENIRIAFQRGSNGLGIINNIESLLSIVGDTIDDCARKTADWAKELNFAPFLESIKNMLKDIEPAISAIAGAASDLWNNTLLPFYKYLIEDGFKKLNEVIGKIGGGDWSKFSETAKTLTEALEPFFELAWETLLQIIEDLGQAIKDFLNSDTLGGIVENFKEWAENADPEDLATKIERAVKAFIELQAALHLISKVILPVVTGFMTIKNFFGQMGMVKEVARITEAIAKLNGETSALSGVKFTGTSFGNFISAIKNLAKVLPTPLELLESLTTKLGAFAKPGGVLTAITGVFTALAGGADMMANGFSISSEALTVFGGVLTSIGLILAGVAAWPAVIVGALVALVANLAAFGDELYDFFVTGFGDILNQVHEFFDNLGHNIGVKVGELLAKLLQGLSELPGKLWNWISSVDWKEFGINILKGILAIFMSIPDMLVLIIDAIGSFLAGFIKGLKEGFDMHSPSKKMMPYGVMILQGILEGIKSAVTGIGNWVVTNIFTPIMNAVKSAFGIVGNIANKFITVGNSVMTGIKNGISNAVSSVSSTVSSVVNTIRSYFTSMLSSNTLWATGYNLLVGLVNGIINGFNMAYDRVRSGCQNIVNIARSIFNIHSPSKVFEEIGGFLMEGMTEGIDKEADNTNSAMETAMNNIIPDPDVDNDFGQLFLDKLTTMKQDAVNIVNSMAEEMQKSMLGLSDIFNGNFDIANQMNKINKLSNVQAPSIAQGQVLPATASFVLNANQQEQDYSSLANTLSKAIVDAITATRYNNTDSGDTVIQIDGREVFRAVKAQNQLYQKSTGKSAF